MHAPRPICYESPAMKAKLLATSIAIAVVAACQPQTATVAPPGECAAPRIAVAYERMPATQRPADVPPRPSLLPTPELTDQEAAAVGDCMRPRVIALANASGDLRLKGSGEWRRFSSQFYSSEHGRYLEVAGNAAAEEFLKFEDGAPLPVGAVVTKRSYRVLQSGSVVIDPQFVIERMPKGYDERVGDWKFTLIAPSGEIVGESRGQNWDKVEFCVECHKSAWRQDFLFFVPPPYRPKG